MKRMRAGRMFIHNAFFTAVFIHKDNIATCWYSEDSCWSMICQVCLEDVSTGSGIFWGGCAKVFLESKVGEPLLKASHTPSDHIAQLLHSHTVSAGWGALLLSVKQIHSDWWASLSILHLSPRTPSHPACHNCAETQWSDHNHKSSCLHSPLTCTVHLSYWFWYTPPGWARQEAALDNCFILAKELRSSMLVPEDMELYCQWHSCFVQGAAGQAGSACASQAASCKHQEHCPYSGL